MSEHPWQPLRLLGLDDVKMSEDFCLVDAEDPAWLRPPAKFVLDVSNGTYKQPTLQYVRALSSPMPRHQRGIYRNSLKEQLVYGSHHFNAFIGRGNEIQFQGVDDARFRIEYHVAHQTLSDQIRVPRIRRHEEGFQISYQSVPPEAIERLEGPIFFGSPIEPMNWGMWLLQGVQSASQFVSSGQEGRLLCMCSASFQRSLLNFIGVDPDRIIDQKQWAAYFCKHVSLLQYSKDVSFAVRESDRQVYATLVEKAHSEIDTTWPKRIFVSRRSISRQKGGAYRALLNEDALIDAIRSAGFTVVEPESLSFPEQICMFSEAEIVVGLGGAGMFNTVFCRPGTKVVTIESSVAFVDNHATLFASLGHDYGVILGSRDVTDDAWPHHRWTVDVAGVVRSIREFC
jgi:capsular polysaccharide biosynthesis protein